MNHFDFKRVAVSVYGTLIENPKCRDDDRQLMATIWKKETKAKTFDEFISELLGGELTNFESASRMRRKIQERNKDLRGDNYENRKKMAKVVAHQMTFNF